MLRVYEICLVVALAAVIDMEPEMVDGVETAYWNEVDLGAGSRLLPGLGRTTTAEDALRVLRSVPLTELSAGQRRQVKRRILSVLGLDHVPRLTASGVRRGRRAAVAAYMMALYRGGTDHDDDDAASTTNSFPDDWADSGLLSSDWRHLDSADTVISFANQGLYAKSSVINNLLQCHNECSW